MDRNADYIYPNRNTQAVQAIITSALQNKNQQKGKKSYYFLINLGILGIYPKIFKLLSGNRE
jgi:hypothetical protein